MRPSDVIPAHASFVFFRPAWFAGPDTPIASRSDAAANPWSTHGWAIMRSGSRAPRVRMRDASGALRTQRTPNPRTGRGQSVEGDQVDSEERALSASCQLPVLHDRSER